MKILFIKAKYTRKIIINKSFVNKLPKKIGLVTTVQFADQIKEVKKQLVGHNVFIYNRGVILGCEFKAAEKIKDKVTAFLYIGTGKFHPIGVALKTSKPVFCFNPITNQFDKISNKEVERYKKRKKGALTRFLISQNVGVLISIKPGQYRDFRKLDLEKKFPNKRFYYFIFDTLDYKELENFPFIEAWINTACPRLDEDINVINIEDLDLI